MIRGWGGGGGRGGKSEGMTGDTFHGPCCKKYACLTEWETAVALTGNRAICVVRNATHVPCIAILFDCCVWLCADETLDDIEKIFMYLRKRVRVPDGVQFKVRPFSLFFFCLLRAPAVCSRMLQHSYQLVYFEIFVTIVYHQPVCPAASQPTCNCPSLV